MALEKYTDPGYDTIDQGVEAKLGLPSGLLTAIRTRGERSNADQVSSAGAKTSYQVIPETRDAILAKYKIDPWLSPENAALGAGYLLKEGLERNRGDAAQAVGEYVGGLDRKNWGPVTKSYINRVMTGFKAPSAEAPQQGGRRLTQELAAQQPSQPSIAKIFQAYQSGEMPADIASEFEADVRAGKVLLPRGSEIKAAPAAPVAINAAVMKAYTDGTMPPDVRAELEADVKAGRAVIESVASRIPGQTGEPVTALPTPEAPAPSLGERIIGAGEAGLSTATGLTGGALGLAAGTIGGLAGAVMRGEFGTPEGTRNVEQAATEGMQALTYQPRTAQGQQQAQAIGEVLQQAIPVMPLTGELATAGRAAAAAAPSARAAAGSVAQQTAAAAQQVPARVAQAVRRAPEPEAKTFGGSVGAAGTNMETLRDVQAASLPVPVELTRGAATRDAAQLAFEKEHMKSAEFGGPLRDRAEANAHQIMRNFDSFVDETGAVAPDIHAASKSVVGAIASKAAADKAKIRVAYVNAEKAGEMAAPVSLGKLVDYLNESAPDAATAPLLTTARAQAIKLGIAEDVNGTLRATRGPGAGGSSLMNNQPNNAVTLKTAETFRQAINRNTDFEPTNIRQATIIKKLIDEATEGQGGDIYREARKLRTDYARKYENRAVVADLITNRKGMDDPKVAIDKVFDRTVMQGSADELRFLRRVLQTSGEDGKQAWKELQGATINHIREASTALTKDSLGRDMPSTAKLAQIIKKLDKNGKLEIMFGKKGAETMRTLNEVAAYVNTVPPGTLINSSGTAGTLMAAMAEMGATGTLTGLPLPIVSGLRQISKAIKDRKLRKRIDEALRGTEQQPIQGRGSQL